MRYQIMIGDSMEEYEGSPEEIIKILEYEDREESEKVIDESKMAEYIKMRLSDNGEFIPLDVIEIILEYELEYLEEEGLIG